MLFCLPNNTLGNEINPDFPSETEPHESQGVISKNGTH
jgi:hypothetical protein